MPAAFGSLGSRRRSGRRPASHRRIRRARPGGAVAALVVATLLAAGALGFGAVVAGRGVARTVTALVQHYTAAAAAVSSARVAGAARPATAASADAVHSPGPTPSTGGSGPSDGTPAAAGVPRAAAAASAAAPPPPEPGPSDWPTFGGGLRNSFAPVASPLTAGVAARLHQAWYFGADGEVSGNPVVVGNRVFFGTWTSTVYAVTRDRGRVVWQRTLDGSAIDGGALYDGGRLFVATAGGRLYALDPADGASLWTTGSLLGGLDDALRAAPRAYGGVIYESLGGNNDSLHEQGGVVAVSEASGDVLWRTSLVDYAGGGAAVFSAPAVLPGLGELVVATGNPTPFPGNPSGSGTPPAGADPHADSLVALSLADGHVIWSTQTHPHDTNDYDFIAAPNAVRLVDGTLAVGDGEKDGSYHLFSAATGKPLWSANLDTKGFETLVLATSAVASGHIFVGTMDVPDAATASNWPGNYQAPGVGRLVALDAGTGTPLWYDSLPGTIAAAPVVGDGVVLAVEANGALIAVDPANGDILWHAQAPGQIWNAEAALALAGRTLLVPLAHPGGVAAYTATTAAQAGAPAAAGGTSGSGALTTPAAPASGGTSGSGALTTPAAPASSAAAAAPPAPAGTSTPAPAAQPSGSASAPAAPPAGPGASSTSAAARAAVG